MSPRVNRVVFRILRWGMSACVMGWLLSVCWRWMSKTVPCGVTMASICAVSCFYILALLLASLAFFGCHRVFIRYPLVKYLAFAVLFIWGCVAYFFHPVDRHRVRNVTMEERIRVRSIESPNRALAAFFPSRGGFESIGEDSSAVHYFAFHASVVFFITCLMFSIFGRGIVNKILAIFAHRRLDVFWGVSEQGLLLAESIMGETYDHEVLFRLPMSLRADKDLLVATTHRIDDIGCLWELSDYRVDNKKGFSKWNLLIGARHFFMLDSGRENVAQANRLVASFRKKDIGTRQKEFYVRINASEDRGMYETWCNSDDVRQKVEPIIVDEPEMIGWDFAQQYSRLKCPSTKTDGKCRLVTDFKVLLIGLGKTGTAVLNEIICNGQLLKAGNDTKTGLEVCAIDKSQGVIDQFKHLHPGFENGIEDEMKLSLDCMDVFSSQFADWAIAKLRYCNQVVVCLSSDEDNIKAANLLHRIQRIHFLPPAQIVVKIGSAEVNDAWREDKDVFGRFGMLCKLYKWHNIDASHVIAIAKAKHSKWCCSADENEQAAADKKWLAASYAERRSSIASAKSEFNFVELLGYTVDCGGGNQDWDLLKQVKNKSEQCIDTLARNEHLRWNAYHVMLGYQRWDLKCPSVDEVEKKKANQLDAIYRHADIVPFDKLPAVDYRLMCAEAPELANKISPSDFVGDSPKGAQHWDREFCRLIPADIMAAGFRICKHEKGA